MIFTADSGLVKIWVANVQNKLYTIEEIPNLFNLKEIVLNVLNNVK